MKPYQEKVYQLLQTVPRGKVTTYGEIGRILGMSPRIVGTTLHLNPDQDNIPCHRVVNRDGRVAPGFAFGGPGIQRKLLEAEGIQFIDEKKVDLEKFLYRFN